ncbi:hypothetical protein AB0D49_34325 [Streptomyces sp. NPDC048290]|uniref:hypothetical protein n=1 Tax=Streptomyces sp. NPDC048290 TaxID=3155811 RepID=UPI0034301E76
MFFRRGRRERRAEETEPYWRQRGWQWSAVFLFLVFAVGGLVTLLAPGSDAGARPAAEGPLSDAADRGDARPGGCATDDRAGAAAPTGPPEDLTWRTLGIARVPVSATAGPTRFDGDVWWCYAHTPTGAALAATVILGHMSEPGWRTVTDQQLVDGGARRMFEFLRSRSEDTVRPPNGAPASVHMGFSLTSYTSTKATVALLIKGDEGFTATSVQLRWDGGDWKVLPQGSGSLYSEPTTASNTTGYVLWGA